ncbi:hypothetical protein F4814DRAFT_447068 [Daldinia grandis]|nr:hypothetical protein F4814DRAFT_447068 [Daldinia grandis]
MDPSQAIDALRHAIPDGQLSVRDTAECGYVRESNPGERWGAVYDNLDSKGLGIAGGRADNCEIGGLALQGDLSFFSSREGFVSDNVFNYKIVLASGEAINANAKQHSDLWKALRGGGNNFGIVTRCRFRSFPQGPI